MRMVGQGRARIEFQCFKARERGHERCRFKVIYESEERRKNVFRLAQFC